MKFGLMALPTESRIVETQHGPIEYGELGRGQPVIALHGGGAGWDHGIIMSERFAGNFRLIVPSRPGYLRTPLQTGVTFEQQADAIMAMMDSLQLEKAAIFAHSAGGPIGFLLAARHPDRVWALIAEAAVASRYIGTPLHRIRPVATTLKERIRLWQVQRNPFTALKSFIRSSSTLPPDDVHRITNAIVADPIRLRHFLLLKQTLYPSAPRRSGHRNDREQLARLNSLPLTDIRAPTLLCHGRLDGDVALSDSEAVAKAIPGSDLFIAEDGFHLMMLATSWRDTVSRQLAFLNQNRPNA